uniref:Uncharacterized protein n=1 Tax=Cyprinus carpio carpio TaxID=630221 RepID=A0A9J8B0B6_CYPCA
SIVRYLSTSEGQRESRRAYGAVNGVLDDCFCDIESIDVFNNFRIYPHIRKLTERDFFRYYKEFMLQPSETLYELKNNTNMDYIYSTLYFITLYLYYLIF